MSVFGVVLEATHSRLSNPLRPLMVLWDKQVGGRSQLRAEVGDVPTKLNLIVNPPTSIPHPKPTHPPSPQPCASHRQARVEAEGLRVHNRLMGEKLDAIKRSPPPEWTITGAWV
jgi:hypothetical protein